MLFSGIIILLFIILGFMYATANLTVYLDKSPYINIFYVLMFISFITAMEILFCIYLYLTFRTKDGEEGPRGFQGFPGNKGDSGKCDQTLCRAESIRVMIQKIFEKKLGRKLNENERNFLFTSPNILENNTPLKKSLIDEDKTGGSSIQIKNMNLEHVKMLHKYITEKVELGYYKIDSQTELDKVFTEIIHS